MTAVRIGIVWMVFLSVAGAQEEQLQRLFTTPEERIELNWVRDNPTVTLLPEDEVKPPEPPVEEAPRYITYNGIILQKNNTPLVWVNNSNNLVQPGFKVELDYLQGNLLPIFLVKANRLIVLKPGQTIDTVDGKILEAYEKIPSSAEPSKSF